MENQTLTTYQQTVVFVDRDQIAVKPLCDFFGIEYDNQVKKIRSDAILQFETGKKPCETLFGDKRERVFLSKKGFLRWIQVLNGSLVRPELQEALYNYQRYIFEYMYGDAARNDQAKIDYIRLKKLKHLYGAIGREIQIVQGNLTNNLDNMFIQQSINFRHHESITE
jgi:P22_AR N-terminal domain